MAFHPPAFRTGRRRLLRAAALALCLPALPLSAQTAAPTWSAVEELRIGDAEDPDYTLSPGVKVTVSPGGEIFALDPTEKRVRVFGAGGRHVRTFGREGPGPGEYQGPEWAGWLGDTLWISDVLQLRVTFLRANGSVIRSFRIGTRPSSLYGPRAPQAMLADGTGLTIPYPPAGLSASDVVRRVPLLRVDRSGKPVDTLAWHPIGHAAFEVAAQGSRRMFMYPPNSLRDAPIVAAAPDGRGIVIVERTPAARAGDAFFEVKRLSARGEVVYSRRYRYAPTPTPSGFRARWARDRAATVAQNQPGINRRELEEKIAEGLYVPPFYPPVTAAVVGRDGTVWLRREEGESGMVTWHVLNERGLIQANLRLPKNVEVHQASRTHLWGVVYDELDVPHVVRYRVNAPARRGR
ncbi:MAG TPA: hypothetical protein VFR81_27160 [Longimicrobium sp.]|nr:hypothetical protein [Longimicrobium sp.]